MSLCGAGFGLSEGVRLGAAPVAQFLGGYSDGHFSDHFQHFVVIVVRMPCFFYIFIPCCENFAL